MRLCISGIYWQYSEKIKDYNCFFFKIPYDGDCDFIHIIRILSRYNTGGKIGLEDKSELGGIYIYSLRQFFNIGYDLRSYLNLTGIQDCKALDVKEYNEQLKKEISIEVIRRIETGQFDRKEAAALAQQGIAFAERMLMELIAEKNLGAIKFYLQTNCRSKYDNTADGLSYEVTRQARKNYKDYLEENGLVDDTDYGNDDCEC